MNDKPLWSGVAADASGEPVRIVDLDVPKTTWSRVHESMRVVHLKLSRQPDPQWIRFFHEERESRINARRAGIWIEDGCIAFDCLLPDVETHHLPDIRRSIEFANERMLELIAARIRERGAQQSADRGERLELEQLRQRVRDLVDPRAAAAPVAATPVAPAPAPAPPPTAIERGAERRSAERRATPRDPAPAVPARDKATPVPVAAAAPPPPAPMPLEHVTATPAQPVAADAAPASKDAAAAASPAAQGPRSLESSLDAYRDALRRARERSTDGPADPPKKSR